MLAGEDVSAPRAPRVPLASRLSERDGRRNALRGRYHTLRTQRVET